MVEEATRRPRTAQVWDAAKVVLVFSAAGPLIGLMVFAVGLALISVAGGQPEAVWIAPFILLYGILFAHFIGLPWAFLAGAFAAGFARFVGPHRWLGAASGACSFAIAALSDHVHLPADASSSGDPKAVDSFGIAFFVLMAAVHVLSAMACWSIARRFVRS